ncbi:hypothetical protein ES705_43043 [subsurface metagenome]
MVTQSMKRLAMRITETAASTYTEESVFTPVVAQIRQAMLIHRIIVRMSRGVRANTGVTDAHGGLNERSFDAEPEFDDEDVIFQLRGNSIFTGSSGEPDVVYGCIKDIHYDPPLVYVKPKMYGYSRSIASTATQNTEIEIFYTVDTLTKDEWIAAISEGL